jgi:hypothetical protein
MQKIMRAFVGERERERVCVCVCVEKIAGLFRVLTHRVCTRHTLSRTTWALKKAKNLGGRIALNIMQHERNRYGEYLLNWHSIVRPIEACMISLAKCDWVRDDEGLCARCSLLARGRLWFRAQAATFIHMYPLHLAVTDSGGVYRPSDVIIGVFHQTRFDKGVAPFTVHSREQGEQEGALGLPYIEHMAGNEYLQKSLDNRQCESNGFARSCARFDDHVLAIHERVECLDLQKTNEQNRENTSSHWHGEIRFGGPEGPVVRPHMQHMSPKEPTNSFASHG